ncbi:MAG: T9SS type A sorting domain-containing protein [Melioribacteraceae bacterium]|nr:T9SS type A sorting domain-containing protein [Melioribacteraceae bacterium]MCF8263180.1 T9SS type A sorting domain-containing protein [Melioribacteraceae bacterium]MCF8414042.1 T9SS type A sorting domain-containing protein [Melioribacteraceae bacterium]MCF8430332.1 T9SS type A sorting domain-containing protein [Melioribacteraceae bacterium]
MTKFLRTVIFFFISFSLYAQHTECDGKRYIERVFSGTVKTADVKYGEATSIAGNFKELRMDIYEPENDSIDDRPVIVLAHGGSFIQGERSQLEELCIDFARRGYVTATITYRLFDKSLFTLDSLGIQEEGIMAIMDMKAAVRYFREDAATNNLYKIDPNLIFAGGASAGAIMAANAGLMDSTDTIPQFLSDLINKHGGWDGNSSSNLEYSSHISGILNYSGAVFRKSVIDADDAPIYSAHDDNDPIVPYGTKAQEVQNSGIKVFLEGSGSIKTKSDEVGLKNQLFTIPNSTGHVSFFEENILLYGDTVVAQSSKFLHDLFCTSPTGIRSKDETSVQPTFSIYPNPAQTNVNFVLPSHNEDYNIAIYNVLGERVFYKSNVKSQIKINTVNLSTGIYFARIGSINSGVKPVTKKLIIRK